MMRWWLDRGVDGRHLDGEGEVVIHNYPAPPLIAAGNITLRPWEALVLRGRA